MLRAAVRIAILAALLLAGAAAAADLAGWEGTRWGMTGRAVDALFGERVQPIEPPLRYGGAYADRRLAEVTVAGYAYEAQFQFGDATGRLQQVLLERRRQPDAPKAYAAALAEFDRLYGRPSLFCDSPRRGPGTSPILRERVWRLAGTTVHLSYLDFTGGTLRYDPFQEIDPLVPEFRRRLHARRSYPQRLLIRYHPSERTDLMSASCGGEGG